MREIAVIQLITDWKRGHGYAALTAKDRRRAHIYAVEGLEQDTPENRYYLAAEQGRNNLPVAVFWYDEIADLRHAKPLYTVTREDYDAYLAWSDEQDRKAHEKWERQQLAKSEA